MMAVSDWLVSFFPSDGLINADHCRVAPLFEVPPGTESQGNRSEEGGKEKEEVRVKLE